MGRYVLVAAVCFLIVCPAWGQCIDAPPDLVSWWNGEGNAADIVDGNHGTLQGGIGFATGVVGQAFQLDGVDDFVEIGPTANLQPPQATSISVAAWAMRFGPATGAYPNAQIIVGKAALTGIEGPYLRWQDGHGHFAVPGANASYFGTTDLDDNQWYHIAGTYDGNSHLLTLYVDGQVEGTSQGTGPMPTDSVPWRIGHSSFSGVEEPFHGLIDEVHVWNRALDQSEIQAIFDAGSDGLCSCTDHDEDGYGRGVTHSCTNGTAQDCNDASATTFPGAAEVCDGYDNDCDGQIDDSQDCDTTCDSPEKLDEDLRISDPDSMAFNQSLAWTGVGYGVAWEDERHGSGNPEIYFVLLDGHGNPVGTDVRVTDAAQASRAVTLVWTGAEFGMAWVDGRNLKAEIFFTRLDATGTELGDDVLIATSDVGIGMPSLVWTGAGYAVAWSAGNSGIYFAQLDATGIRIGSDTLVTASPNASPSLAWNGSGFGVVWSDRRVGGAEPEIYFVRLNESGIPVGPESLVSNTDGESETPALRWNGYEFGVAWAENVGMPLTRNIYFARLDQVGNRIGSETIVTTNSSEATGPTLAWTGSEYGVAWRDGRHGDQEVYFQRVDALGQLVGTDIRVTNDPATSQRPSMAWNGSEFDLVWSDSRSGHDIYFALVGCNCTDRDDDGFTNCGDCDDADPLVFPGAAQVCDGANNDCDDPIWPALPASETDDDTDMYTECDRDCDDTNNTVYPGATELCDGLNNDCDDPEWPTPPPEDADDDFDTLAECEGDCDDTDGAVYPGAPQLCDGLNNDCLDANWPTVPSIESDDDSDLFAECQGDCNDTDPVINPDATETCNAIDDNCNTLVDEDDLGEDTDGDGVHNLCDNCREDVNPSQLDVDDDNVGNSCDNCILEPNTDQSDRDLDDRGDACDNCVTEANYDQGDYDGDSYGDACDNCFFDWNPTQTDMDSDYEGDICDVDDGVIYVRFHQPEWVEWQEELGFDSWNSYRGDLAVLKGMGLYTQDPALVPLASHSCDLTVPWEADVDPPAGAALFFLTTGNYSGTGVESGLGTDSDGIDRLNANPCP